MLKEHPVWTAVFAVLLFIFVTLPVWLATIWPLFSAKTLPQWLSERSWPMIPKEVTNGILLSIGVVVTVLLVMIVYQHSSEARKMTPSLPAWVKPSEVYLPIASYNEMEQDSIIGKTIILPEVPRDPKNPTRIYSKKFENCLILGPAVLSVIGEFEFDLCRFGIPEKNPDNLVVTTKATALQGTIDLVDCRFIGCHIRGITLIGTQEQASRFLASFPSRNPQAQ